MNNNFLYIGISTLIAVVIFTLALEDDESQSNIPVLKEQQEKTITRKKENQYQEIEISYINQKKDNKDKIINNEIPIEDKNEQKEDKKTVYELISTGSTIEDYQINIVSNSPIPSRNSSQFPQLPASIHGKINGKGFSLVVPSDLKVKDFKIKVRNQSTGETNFIPLQEEHIKAGGSSILRIDTNNFENIELRSENIQSPPLPPFPSLPGFPSK